MPSKNGVVGARRVARPGPSGGTRVGSVLPLQRRRIVAAAIELIARDGLASTSIGGVCGRAGVSRRTFYELFADRDECFAAAFDYAVGRAAGVVVPAYLDERSTQKANGAETASETQRTRSVRRAGGAQKTLGWRERTRSSLAALLALLDAEPALARLLVVEALAGGPLVIAARARVVAVLIGAVEEGREEARAGSSAPELSAEGVVGAVIAIVHARMLAAPPTGPTKLVGLTSQLMSIVALPYLGAAAAAREGVRPVPAALSPQRHLPAEDDPFRDLPMRLTYRTACVLSSIAHDPGASSKQIADTAGISDQGQISRLLGRLERLGLIHNDGAPPGRGEAKAWTLTERGQGVVGAVGTGS